MHIKTFGPVKYMLAGWRESTMKSLLRIAVGYLSLRFFVELS
jgi:hypothetical protein